VITGQEIELKQDSLYPEVLDNKRVGTSVDNVSDILVYQGEVSEEQVRLALEARKSHPSEDLGGFLLSLGFISGSDLAQAKPLELDYVEFSESDVDRDVVVSYLRGYGASRTLSRSGYPVPGVEIESEIL